MWLPLCHTHWLPPGSSFSKLVSTPALTDLILSVKITPMIAQGSRKDHLRVAPARTMRGVRLSTQTRPALPLEPPRPAPTCVACASARARSPARPLSPAAPGLPAAAAPARNAPPINSDYNNFSLQLVLRHEMPDDRPFPSSRVSNSSAQYTFAGLTFSLFWHGV